MVLDVVGHVPHNKPYEGVGKRGARIDVHVGVKGTSTMLSQQDKTQERLAEDRRHHPIYKYGRPSSENRHGDQRVERRMNSRFADDRRSVGLRHKGVRHVAERVTHDPLNLSAGEGNPKNVPEIGSKGHWLRGQQFRIVFGVLRETVMIHVEPAKVRGRYKNEKAEHGCHHIVDPPAAKCGAVNGFVKAAKKKDEYATMDDHRGNLPPQARRQRNRRPGAKENRQMAAQSTPAPAIRTCH